MNFDCTIPTTNFNFPHQSSFYKGKVRDIYRVKDKILMIATDRISTFDVILPVVIPFKGQVLNQLAYFGLKNTKDICPNWLEEIPDPNVAVGIVCTPLPIEMVVRGYLTGHAWRTYKYGKRKICGVKLPEGLKEHDRLPNPIITPTIKAKVGQHDEDISKKEIISQKRVDLKSYEKIEEYAFALFERGTDLAKERGLILVDTKYEFGMKEGEVILIDEIHTPDSSRYFYLDGYEKRQEDNSPQKQLSKEFVRQWLIERGFQGLDGQKTPPIPAQFIEEITQRYIELYQLMTQQKFVYPEEKNAIERVENNINSYLLTS